MRCILSSSFWFFRISANRTSLIFKYSLAILIFLVISSLTRGFRNRNRLLLKYSLCTVCTCDRFWCHWQVNSYHLTLLNFVVRVKLVIKMHGTVSTQTVYHSEIRIDGINDQSWVDTGFTPCPCPCQRHDFWKRPWPCICLCHVFPKTSCLCHVHDRVVPPC